ncbi:MAG: hypothetical protein GY847_10340 [Proteobacteria bacterium]|nr:hypothetical protein [Pseudomonadota bacterium]
MHRFRLIVFAALAIASCEQRSKKEPNSEQDECIKEKTKSQKKASINASSTTDGDEYDRDADLEQLAWWVSMEHSFSVSLWSEAQQAIAGHRKDKTKFTDAEFYMEVRRIVALPDNGHTNVSGSPIYEKFGMVPLRVYWFSDGLYIVRAKEQHKNLLGGRIEAINGKSLDELETLLMAYHGGTKAFFRQYTAMPLMLSPALLHAIGLSESPEQLKIKVRNRSGEALETNIKVGSISKAERVYPWRYLHPAPIDKEEDWHTIHAASTKLPLYLQQEEEVFRYALIEDGKIAYVQLRANIGSDDKTIEDFAAKTKKQLKSDRPHSIILDNRQNPGGDLTRTADFALELPSLASPDGKVYVLTSNGTFSAGLYTSFFPKAADSKRTIVVGEHVGDRPQFWSESGPEFVLRDSGYSIGYSLQMHDLANGCKEPKKCHMAIYPPKWNIAVGSLEPDWKVPTNFADYEAGLDKVLKRVLEDASLQR